MTPLRHPITVLALVAATTLSAPGELIPSAGVRAASFKVAMAGNSGVTGESAPDGRLHNEDGLDISGPDSDVTWTQIGLQSGAQSSGTESGITLTVNTNTTTVAGESPGGFDPGDLRDRTLRLLGNGFSGQGGVWLPGAHPGFVNWELSGLKPNQAYDLIFYGGDANRACRITIGGDNGITDIEGDANFMSLTPDATGTIAGTWDQPEDFAITNWGGLEVAEVVPPQPVLLTITPNAFTPGHYDFSWAGKEGKVYDLVSEIGLTTAPGTWPVWNGNTNIPSGGTSPMLENIAGSDDPARFFAVIEKDPPVLLSEDFESVTGPGAPTGWATSDNGAGTGWEVGVPSGAAFGPTEAANGIQCAGTNIGADYTASAEAVFITPSFTVPSSGAVLDFSQYIDTELSPSDDLGAIRLLNAGDNSVLAGGDVAIGLEGAAGVWTEESIVLPAVANGLAVKLEFRFTSDAAEQFAGFYIDDVLVTVTP